MIKSILLAVDGSPYSEPILQYGILLGKAFQARLRVLTVMDIRIFEWAVAIGVEGFAPIIPSSTYQEESQRLLEEKAEKVLQRASEVLGEAGVNFQLEKESGSPVDVILEKSKLADLVVMGSRGEFERWSDKMLGATLEAVTRQCTKPVFIVRKHFQPIKRLLVAYDGSVNSNRVLPWAGFIASQLQIPLAVLTVQAHREEAEKILQEAQDYLSAYALPELSLIHKEGDPAEKIVDTCKEIQADLILMGSYGHSRIREAILGSITVQVMRTSPVPILMVK
ncbi:MAG: universal stress protein [Calditrichaeota bacterium]|nr:MAG: universal stress protein [Calditrichota bacterium]